MNVVSLVGRPNGGRLVAEVKRERPRINLRTLREKFNAFVEATGKWRKTAPEFVSCRWIRCDSAGTAEVG